MVNLSIINSNLNNLNFDNGNIKDYDVYKDNSDKISKFMTGFNNDYIINSTASKGDLDDKYSCYILLTPGIYHFDEQKTEENTLFILPTYPDDVSDSVDAQWGTVAVLGRPVPVATFTGTGYRSVSFSFDIHREMLGQSNISTIEDFLFGIKQAVYPSDVDFIDSRSGTEQTYTGFVPRVATVKLGAFFVKGYITSVGHTWKKPLVYNAEQECYQYQLCTVSMSINGIDMSQFSR